MTAAAPLLVRLLLAAVFTVIGVAGTILPLLPGWLFYGLALLVLFPNAPLARRTVERVGKRFPAAGRLLRVLVPGVRKESP